MYLYRFNYVNSCKYKWESLLLMVIAILLFQPLALLSWGCRLPMSYVNPTVVKQFIWQKALRGPEKISRDGQFRDGLLKSSDIVTDSSDSVLCPNAY